MLMSFRSFYLSSKDFQNFPGAVVFFQDFPVLETATLTFQDFPGLPGHSSSSNSDIQDTNF